MHRLTSSGRVWLTAVPPPTPDQIQLQVVSGRWVGHTLSHAFLKLTSLWTTSEGKDEIDRVHSMEV